MYTIDPPEGFFQVYFIEGKKSEYRNQWSFRSNITQEDILCRSWDDMDRVDEVWDLLATTPLCGWDRERECLSYAVVKSSGLSTAQARKTFGFQNLLSSRLSQVHSAIKHAQYISESIEKLARTKRKALLQSSGFDCQVSSSDSEYSDITDDKEPCCEADDLVLLIWQNLLKIVSSTILNFFIEWEMLPQLKS